MKKMIIPLTDDRRAQLREALDKNAKEITISYEEKGELSEAELGSVQGGAVNAYLLVDGRPGPSTSKSNAIDILSFSFG